MNHRRIWGTHAWRTLSKQTVREEPSCWLHLPGCTLRSTTADHIIPIVDRPDLALTRANVRGACRSCNSLRRDTPLHRLAALRANSMSREQAVLTLRNQQARSRPPALAIFDTSSNA
jgi:5-methylcytosine-specific restriction endonuclease McrA